MWVSKYLQRAFNEEIDDGVRRKKREKVDAKGVAGAGR
jgi:hypothetical protein